MVKDHVLLLLCGPRARQILTPARCKSRYTGVTSGESGKRTMARTVRAAGTMAQHEPSRVDGSAAVALVVAACGSATATPSISEEPAEEPTMTAHSTLRPGSGRSCSTATATDALRGYGMDGFPADRWVVEARRAPHGARLRDRPGHAGHVRRLRDRVRMARRSRGNSGVMYRVVETAEPAWTTGPEYQVLDDALHPDGRDPTTSAAALYDLIAPAAEQAPRTGRLLQPRPDRRPRRPRRALAERRARGELRLGRLRRSGTWWPRASSLGSRVSWLPSPATSCSSTTARKPRSGISESDRWVPDGRTATLATWPNAIPMTFSASREAPARRRSRPPGGGSPGSTIRT